MTRFPTGRKGGGASHQRGNAFPRAERGWPVFPRAKARLLGFFIKGRLLSIHRRHHNPRAGGASNLRTFGATAPSNFRTLKPHRAPGRLYVFRRQRRHKKWRRRRRTSPAQRYYITPEGESPQPVREASAGPGQNPWRPGPKARRRHQPSRRSRVNLREYSPAPLMSQIPYTLTVPHSLTISSRRDSTSFSLPRFSSI